MSSSTSKDHQSTQEASKDNNEIEEAPLTDKDEWVLVLISNYTMNYCDDIISHQREMKNMNRHTSQGFLPPYDNNGYDKRRSFGGGGEGSVYLGIPNQGKESSIEK